MIKKIVISILIITSIVIITSIGIFAYALKSIGDYGHHFNFENQLDREIDSLDISIGTINNRLIPSNDGIIESNITVPEKGYPHKVIFSIYHNSKILKLPADSFNCYNCDGSHEYILKEPKAEYIFHN